MDKETLAQVDGALKQCEDHLDRATDAYLADIQSSWHFESSVVRSIDDLRRAVLLLRTILEDR